MKTIYQYTSPIGILRLEEEDDFIVGLGLDNSPLCKESHTTSMLEETVRELSEYFAGKRTAFDVPVRATGTEFQEKVWEQLRRIPYGETRSYGDIAEAAGNPKAARAVGHANNRNPVMILIPCHRVIGADGSLVGFGCGIAAKKYLLDLELHHKA
jgi:methylated-DNA-[protein]-cysteine S-methyltransferase